MISNSGIQNIRPSAPATSSGARHVETQPPAAWNIQPADSADIGSLRPGPVIALICEGRVDVNHPDLIGRVIQVDDMNPPSDGPWTQADIDATHCAGILVGVPKQAHSGPDYNSGAPGQHLMKIKIFGQEDK